MIGKTQLPLRLRKIVKDSLKVYNTKQAIKVVNTIPQLGNISKSEKPIWYNIPSVICVFADMKGSTKLSSELHNKTYARVYRLYVDTAIRFFNKFKPSYLNVHGDGVFAVFDKNYPYTALASAIAYNTFSKETFTSVIEKDLDKNVGSHIGIDQNVIILGHIDMSNYHNTNIRENDIWAGTPVNMAAKLATESKTNEILVSERYFRRIRSRASTFCSCYEGQSLWQEKDVASIKSFDFSHAYGLQIDWCKEHGKEYIEKLLSFDK